MLQPCFEDQILNKTHFEKAARNKTQIKWNKPFTHVNSHAVTSCANVWAKERFVPFEGIGLLPKQAEQVTKELNAASG